MLFRASARRGLLVQARRGIVAALAALMIVTSAAPGLSASELEWDHEEQLDQTDRLASLTPEVNPIPEGAHAPLETEHLEQSERPELDQRPAPPVEEVLVAPVALGDAIVGVAMSYLGYPYVAAGNSPAGFDCSGFTQFVVGVATGIWISHAVEAQPYSAGYWVDWGAWLPGDLIFFQNTYRAGISHVGIYIGDGMIVHAENYESGVTIDSIYSDYYGPRYWGAMRIG
jgi:cell wall-associated NlpC family hydrolase